MLPGRTSARSLDTGCGATTPTRGAAPSAGPGALLERGAGVPAGQVGPANAAPSTTTRPTPRRRGRGSSSARRAAADRTRGRRRGCPATGRRSGGSRGAAGGGAHRSSASRSLAGALFLRRLYITGTKKSVRQRRDQEAADDRAPQRRVLLAALAQAERHRQHADDHRERGHHHRPKARHARARERPLSPASRPSCAGRWRT